MKSYMILMRLTQEGPEWSLTIDMPSDHMAIEYCTRLMGTKALRDASFHMIKEDGTSILELVVDPALGRARVC
jgi:hypothetical protein